MSSTDPNKTAGPVPIEPSAVWRMSVNGWSEVDICKLFHLKSPDYLRAIKTQNEAFRSVDPNLIADPIIETKPS